MHPKLWSRTFDSLNFYRQQCIIGHLQSFLQRHPYVCVIYVTSFCWEFCDDDQDLQCPENMFCNYYDGSSGVCEDCVSEESECTATGTGLPERGQTSCVATCFPSIRSLTQYTFPFFHLNCFFACKLPALHTFVRQKYWKVSTVSKNRSRRHMKNL